MTRWKLTIEYKGTDYAGWQRQNDVPSVQQAIEEAISKFSGQDATLHVAGRTDAGVHACGQVAHVDLEPFKKPMDPFEVSKAINAHLRPQPVAIVKAEIVSDDFHARFSALNKLYRYRILRRGAPPALEQGLVWHYKKPLDVGAMREGAAHLLGHHDFTTFRDSQCQAKSPFKTLDRLDLFVRPYDDGGGEEIYVETEGRSFLHHMVRNMVGTLVLVGEGKWQPGDMKVALEARDRTKGGPTAPADGLYLVRVDY
ncbi:MAG: tRNA pseudouridine(38-40) synthase TruA [Alphaproteobacteria bacterium]|nr:tRNA pseudouridine(38-40) synthase TruA [Alphaproteobacteria bacterium]